LATSKFKKAVLASLLVTVSTLTGLVLGEAAVRTVVNPVDYLRADVVEDERLLFKIAPNSSGHDSWGFRNERVPRAAHVVTIGDSQTYGVGASAGHSWPVRLQSLINEDVYNLSLFGYGPAQYAYLLENRAFDLSPSVVIVGFYYGNDLFDAYNLVYTKEHWSELRREGFVADEELLETDVASADREQFLGGLRNWLAHHSIAYGMFTLSYGNMFRFIEMKYFRSESTDDISILDDGARNLHTGFRPLYRLRGLNLRDPKVREGLRISLELIRHMRNVCSQKEVQFEVALIPTKESVFAEYIENNTTIKNADAIDELIENERQVNQLAREYLDAHNISYVDLLPALRAGVRTQTIFAQSEDGHPNAEGYEVIAAAIEDHLARRNR
jgi:lysophospholipase L1-like esterase